MKKDIPDQLARRKLVSERIHILMDEVRMELPPIRGKNRDQKPRVLRSLTAAELLQEMEAVGSGFITLEHFNNILCAQRELQPYLAKGIITVYNNLIGADSTDDEAYRESWLLGQDDCKTMGDYIAMINQQRSDEVIIERATKLNRVLVAGANSIGIRIAINEQRLPELHRDDIIVTLTGEEFLKMQDELMFQASQIIGNHFLQGLELQIEAIREELKESTEELAHSASGAYSPDK